MNHQPSPIYKRKVKNNSVLCIKKWYCFVSFVFLGQWLHLNIFRNNDFCVFVLVKNFLILYGCVYEFFLFFIFHLSPTPLTWNSGSVPRIMGWFQLSNFLMSPKILIRTFVFFFFFIVLVSILSGLKKLVQRWSTCRNSITAI